MSFQKDMQRTQRETSALRYMNNMEIIISYIEAQKFRPRLIRIAQLMTRFGIANQGKARGCRSPIKKAARRAN